MTQSQCVRWLAKHIDLLGPKKRKPVALCQEFLHPVVSVFEEDTAISAFETMVDKNIQVRQHKRQHKHTVFKHFPRTLDANPLSTFCCYFRVWPCWTRTGVWWAICPSAT